MCTGLVLTSWKCVQEAEQRYVSLFMLFPCSHAYHCIQCAYSVELVYGVCFTIRQFFCVCIYRNSWYYLLRDLLSEYLVPLD